MKLTFEVHGYTITINETEEGVIVSAEKDGEVIEEFELDADLDMEDMDSDDMDSDDMDDDSMEELPDEGEEIEGEEESDFGPEGEETEEVIQEKPMGESKLQSFASFLKKK
jgi:hypothetical protein